MPKYSYGRTVRNRVVLLLKAILDFDSQCLNEALLEALSSQGMRSERSDWQTPAPKITILTSNVQLVELSQLTTTQVREALDLLEDFVQCLKRDFRSQGQEKIYGQLTLWSTDTELNLKYFAWAWDQRRQKKGLKPLETDYQVPNLGELPEEYHFSKASDRPPADQAPPEAPQTDTPFSDADDETSSSQEAESRADPWEQVFDQVANLLRDSLPHSPLFRSLTKIFGLDPQARIKPVDRQNLIIRVKETWIHQYLPNSLSQQPMLLLELENRRSQLSQYRNILWENPQNFGSATQVMMHCSDG